MRGVSKVGGMTNGIDQWSIKNGQRGQLKGKGQWSGRSMVKNQFIWGTVTEEGLMG